MIQTHYEQALFDLESVHTEYMTNLWADYRWF